MASDLLVHHCAVCKSPVEDGMGWLSVDMPLVYERKAAMRAWKAENPDGGFVNLNDLMELPEPVPWLAHHKACDPDPDRSSYWIAIERIRTPRQMLHWSAHLMDKPWLDATNWDDVLFKHGEDS